MFSIRKANLVVSKLEVSITTASCDKLAFPSLLIFSLVINTILTRCEHPGQCESDGYTTYTLSMQNMNVWYILPVY